MTKYYIYTSEGGRAPWRMVRNPERGNPLIYLTPEIASMAMTNQKTANPDKDFMFYPANLGDRLPPETLQRNCGCGKKVR